MPRGRARKEKCLLKGKGDEFVNGYGGSRTGPQDNRVDRRTTNRIQTEEEMYDDYDSEPDEDMIYDIKYDNKMQEYVDSLDIDSDKMKELLTLNEEIGFLARTRNGYHMYKDASSNPVANEAGWIVQYHFGNTVLPRLFGVSDENPSTYFGAWDFMGNDFACEVKTVFFNPETHTSPAYLCPLSKFSDTDRPVNKSEYYVWWTQIKSYEDVIEHRNDIPTEWKFYTCNEDLWNGLDVKTSSNGNKTYYDDGIKQFLVFPRHNKLQMIFNIDVLSDYTYTIN
jgi:hypothetical protein